MGATTYKGMVEWKDNFGGEINAGSYSTSDSDVKRLVSHLMEYAAAATLISLEIKRVNSD